MGVRALELIQLEQLLMIEKSNGMRLAAEKLFLSQPALSHNLKKLENELDCRLFDRSRNQLSINAYGKIMLEHAQRIMNEIDSAKQEIAEEKRLQALKINVGFHSYAFQSFISPQIANALKHNILECKISDKTHLSEGLRDGALDIVFSTCTCDDDEIRTVKLFNEQIMVSLPSSSEFASRQCLYISDLPKLSIYLITNTTGYTDWYEQILGSAGVETPLSTGAPIEEYLYTKDNISHCYLTTSFIIQFVPTAARRVVIPLADKKASRDVYMSYKKRDAERLAPMVSYIENNMDGLFNSSSFLPYFLFPDKTKNLIFTDDK